MAPLHPSTRGPLLPPQGRAQGRLVVWGDIRDKGLWFIAGGGGGGGGDLKGFRVEDLGHLRESQTHRLQFATCLSISQEKPGKTTVGKSFQCHHPM